MVTQKEFLADIDVALGGRVAEELIFGAENVTSGASSDLRKATATATRRSAEPHDDGSARDALARRVPSPGRTPRTVPQRQARFP